MRVEEPEPLHVVDTRSPDKEGATDEDDHAIECFGAS
jgi:hypothetical protein